MPPVEWAAAGIQPETALGLRAAACGVLRSSTRCRRGAALQERAVMGRITRQPSKPKFVHEVQVSRAEVDKPWLNELLARIAGPNGYRKRTPFWAYTIFSFVHQGQADEMRLYVGRHREVAAKLEAKSRPCPVAIKYQEAALAQYAVIWGLSTGLMREVVRTYRRERRDCSTHGMPRAFAAAAPLGEAPAPARARLRRQQISRSRDKQSAPTRATDVISGGKRPLTGRRACFRRKWP